jgi:hypothetical protein
VEGWSDVRPNISLLQYSTPRCSSTIGHPTQREGFAAGRDLIAYFALRTTPAHDTVERAGSLPRRRNRPTLGPLHATRPVIHLDHGRAAEVHRRRRSGGLPVRVSRHTNLTRDETWASRKRNPFRAMAMGLCLEGAFDRRGVAQARAQTRNGSPIPCKSSLLCTPSHRPARLTLPACPCHSSCLFTIVRSPLTRRGLFRLFVSLEQLRRIRLPSAQGVCRAAGTVRHRSRFMQPGLSFTATTEEQQRLIGAGGAADCLCESHDARTCVNSRRDLSRLLTSSHRPARSPFRLAYVTAGPR